MPRYSLTTSATITPTPDELARCFAEMADDDQAAFFATLGDAIKEWDVPGLAGFQAQMRSVKRFPGLTEQAKGVLSVFGEVFRE